MFAQSRMLCPSSMAQRLDNHTKANTSKKKTSLSTALPPNPTDRHPSRQGQHPEPTTLLAGDEGHEWTNTTASLPGAAYSTIAYQPKQPGPLETERSRYYPGKRTRGGNEKDSKEATTRTKNRKGNSNILVNPERGTSVGGRPEGLNVSKTRDSYNRRDPARTISRIDERGRGETEELPGRALGMGRAGGRGKKQISRAQGDKAVLEGHQPPNRATDNALLPCDWCGEDISNEMRSHCLDCPFDLCTVCAVNGSIIYSGHDESHRCPEIQPAAGSIGKGIGNTGLDHAKQLEEPSAHFTCTFCDTELPNVRYECQLCPDISLCEDDREFHIDGHPLRRVDSQNRGNTSDCQKPIGKPTQDRGDDTPTRPRHALRHNIRRKHDSEEDDTNIDSTSSGESPSDDDRTDKVTLASNGDSSDDEYNDDDEVCRELTSRTKGGRKQRLQLSPHHTPTHINLKVPLEGFDIMSAWAKAILEQGPAIRHRQTLTPAESSTHRQAWLAEDKRHLKALKEDGCTNLEAAEILGRTTSAVAQQWRKQR